jgi:hypothetical protein
MKKQFFTCLLICLITGGVSVAAKSKLTASPESVIAAYIDAFKNSDAAILKEIMHDDAYITMARQSQVIKHTKTQLVQFYKKEKSMLNCSASHQIVSCCDAVAVINVDFKFENFTQRNYITIEKNENNEWKVMNVNKFFS